MPRREGICQRKSAGARFMPPLPIGCNEIDQACRCDAEGLQARAFVQSDAFVRCGSREFDHPEIWSVISIVIDGIESARPQR
jgi:hypothetical protein